MGTGNYLPRPIDVSEVVYIEAPGESAASDSESIPAPKQVI